MNLDEVYQAALAAGSGGIRWDSITNWIQVMDQNKNWVDWRYYNPNYTITHDVANYGSSSGETTMDVALSKRGLYCLSCVGHISDSQSGDTITTNALIRNSYISPKYGTNHYVREYIVYSTGEGETAALKMSGTGVGGARYAIYIGPYTNISNPDIYCTGNDTAEHSGTVTTHDVFIHFATGGKNVYTKNFISSGIESENINIVQGPQNAYSAVCINRNGSATYTGTAGITSGVVGTLLCSVYTLVE